MSDGEGRHRRREHCLAILEYWEAEGFITPGWSIRWIEQLGVHFVRFQTSSHAHELPEQMMAAYVLGVADRARFAMEQPMQNERGVE